MFPEGTRGQDRRLCGGPGRSFPTKVEQNLLGQLPEVSIQVADFFIENRGDVFILKAMCVYSC